LSNISHFIIPEKQTAAVSSSEEPPISNVGAHAGKNTFAAMAMARQQEHEGPKPMS
jgi:hypothetical protein